MFALSWRIDGEGSEDSTTDAPVSTEASKSAAASTQESESGRQEQEAPPRREQVSPGQHVAWQQFAIAVPEP